MATWSEPLSRQDSGYLLRETVDQPMHFVLACILEGSGGPITLDAVRNQIAARVHRIPALRTRLVRPPFDIGPPRWVDAADLDIDDHVLPWPLAPDRVDLLPSLEDLTMRPLERDKPLWRMHVRPGTETDPPIIALAAHHALMDGGLMRKVVDALFDPAPLTASPTYEPRRRPSSARLLSDGLRAAVRARVTRPVERAPGTGSATGMGAVSHGVLTGPVGPERSIRLATFPLRTLREVARSRGVTVNDVFVAMVAAGLRAHVLTDGGVPGKPIVALVPRDVRSEQEARATGNRTWSMFVELPLGEPDPSARLTAINAATSAAKQAHAPAGNAAFQFDVAISNVRLGGPHAAAGVPIVAYHATVPLQGRNRLAVVGLSTVDTFAITVTADGAAFEDLDVFAGGIERGLQELDGGRGH